MDEGFQTDYRAAARAMLVKNIPATMVVDRLQERGVDPGEAYRIAFSQKILHCQEQQRLALGGLGLGLVIMAGGAAIWAVMGLQRTGMSVFVGGAGAAIGGYIGLDYFGNQMKLAKKRLAAAPG